MFQFWVVPGASYAVAVSRREGENSYGSHAERFSFSTSADTCGYSGGVSNRRRRCESTRRARSVYRQRGCIKEADEVMAGCRMHGRILSCNGPPQHLLPEVQTSLTPTDHFCWVKSAGYR